MPGNSFGKLLVLSTFGESHGMAVGGVLDGFPSNIEIDIPLIQSEINRRNPAGYPFSTPRTEQDQLEILSGIFEGRSTGAPIAFVIQNKDARPEDYDHLKTLYRPSHADFTYDQKFGYRDYRGGGRSSARATIAVVTAGAMASQVLKKAGVEIIAFVSQIGPFRISRECMAPQVRAVRSSPLACPDPDATYEMLGFLEEVRKAGDTAGGVVSCIIRDAPAGLGEPVFDKLQADLAKAMFSINAVKGFEYGSGFKAAEMRGSSHNDPFVSNGGKIVTSTNNSGGIQGGISNGMDISFNVAFKPVSTIGAEQTTVDLEGKPAVFSGKGRHDVCVVPRAVPIVEAMSALVIADHYLRQKANMV